MIVENKTIVVLIVVYLMNRERKESVIEKENEKRGSDNIEI